MDSYVSYYQNQRLRCRKGGEILHRWTLGYTMDADFHLSRLLYTMKEVVNRDAAKMSDGVANIWKRVK